MSNLLLVGAALYAAIFAVIPAHADAGYGRGPESDPIATPILATATGAIATLQGQMSTATGAIATLQGRTSTWDQAATDASSATGDVATLQGQMSSVTGDVATLQAGVWGAPGLTPATNGLENAVTIQTKSIAGGDLAGYRVLHVWVSDSDLGAASTNNIETLVLSTGTAISTVTTNADYWYCSASNGSALATVTATAAGTNYLMCADGSTVSSTPITFTSE